MKAVIVLEALREGCDSYSGIASYAIERHGVSISEKTIRRHIELLRNLGYEINKNGQGFILGGDVRPVKKGKLGTSAYPLILLRILQGLNFYCPKQAAIVVFFRADYGCRINRKAVGRNIKGLRELGYNIVRIDGGYKLNQP